MEWQGEINKRPTTGNGVGASSLEIRTGNLSKSLTLWTCIWAQTECSTGCDLWSIFWKCFEQSISWCFGSHFFLIDSLPFATVVFWLHLKTKTKFKEKHGKKTPLSAFHCNQLQHTRSACFKTDLPDHFRFNFVQVVTEPCGSVVLLWRHGGHVNETRDFQLQTTQMLEASCLFSFKSILLRTSGKCQSIKRTACMLNFIYIVQSKWYLRLTISVQGPFTRLSLSLSGSLSPKLVKEV